MHCDNNRFMGKVVRIYYLPKVFYAIWVAGVCLLIYLWEIQKTISGNLGYWFAYVIQVIGYFYPIAFLRSYIRFREVNGK